MNNNKHKFYDYELTTEGRIKWFSYILDDFEEYIKEYWNKTQSEDWDNVPVLPESFRVEYVEKQFDSDFDTEDAKRLEAFNNGEDEGNNEGWLPISCVNWILVKNTPENLEKLKDAKVLSYEVWEDFPEFGDDSCIHVETLAIWYWRYYNDKLYSEETKENFSGDTDIPLEEIQKENIHVNE